jgi:hypothetical protein
MNMRFSFRVVSTAGDRFEFDMLQQIVFGRDVERLPIPLRAPRESAMRILAYTEERSSPIGGLTVVDTTDDVRMEFRPLQSPERHSMVAWPCCPATAGYQFRFGSSSKRSDRSCARAASIARGCYIQPTAFRLHGYAAFSNTGLFPVSCTNSISRVVFLSAWSAVSIRAV